jgi:hypothetical protein
MAAYVTLTEDKFGPISKSGVQADDFNDVDNSYVRRPLHGMMIPEDSYATITVRFSNNKKLKVLANTSSQEVYKNTSTTNMIVQRVDESRQEKQQIIETFGEDFVYYYGQRPRMITVSAMLPESEEFQYAQEFWTNYDRVLRGTKLVTRDARVFFTVAGQLFEGYLSTAQTSRTADQPRLIQLSFQMYVTHSYYLSSLRNTMTIKSSEALEDNGTLEIESQREYTEARKGDYLRLPKKLDKTNVRGYDPTKKEYQSDVLKVYRRIVSRGNTLRTLGTGGFDKFPEFDVYSIIYSSDKLKLPVKSNSLLSFPMESAGISTYIDDTLDNTAGVSSALSGIGNALALGVTVATGGLIAYGAVSAIADDINAFDGDILDYLNDRIVQPVIDETLEFLGGFVDIGENLINAGYQLTSIEKPISESSEIQTFSDSVGVLTIESPRPEDELIFQSDLLDNELPPAETMIYITSGNSNTGSDDFFSINDDTVIGTSESNILNEVIGL